MQPRNQIRKGPLLIGDREHPFREHLIVDDAPADEFDPADENRITRASVASRMELCAC